MSQGKEKTVLYPVYWQQQLLFYMLKVDGILENIVNVVNVKEIEVNVEKI